MARMALLAMFITEIFLLSSAIASMANEAICRSLPTIPCFPNLLGRYFAKVMSFSLTRQRTKRLASALNCEPTISGLHTIPARPRFFFGTGYLGHYLNSDAYHRQLLPLMQGIKVISVSKAALQDTQVRFPGLSEQAAIGAALSEIDNLITLHQRKRLWFAK